MAKAYRLCYLEGEYQGMLYFTDNFGQQWGDDWDDAPYRCNAGEPYEVIDDMGDDVNASRGHIKVLGFKVEETSGNIATQYDANYSVDDINKLRVPWMYNHKEKTGIYGGNTVMQVIRWCRKNGVKVGVLK